MTGKKFWKVRTTLRGRRIFIHARSYNDARQLQRRFGGKIL